MNIPYETINEALKAQLEGVELRPCDWSEERPYVLRFGDNNVDKDIIKQAQLIVNYFIPSEWYEDEMRIVE